MTEKESTFVSVVIYCDDIVLQNLDVLKQINDEMVAHFDHFEIVCAVDGDTNGISSQLREVARGFAGPTTLVEMGRKQGLEAAMNAGIDMAVGDYVFEVDRIDAFDLSFLVSAFGRSRIEGDDIVSGVARKPSLRGGAFYPIFNRFSNTEGKLETGTARLVSRRALNRVHSMSSFMPYRKAAYAASGLKMSSLPMDAATRARTHDSTLGLAVDSLALYTDFFYKLAAFISTAMACISLLELIYVIIVLVQGIAIEGWATTMFVLTFGFLGLFVILTLLMKYVDLLVKSSFNQQDYLIENVEKIEGVY